MALVEHLWDDSWYVVCAACCHMGQVFAIMHLYTFNKSFLSRPTLPLQSGIDKTDGMVGNTSKS